MKILLIVGPSGAGKDTLLRNARSHFAKTGRIDFVRRYITRPPDTNEDNYYIDLQGFMTLKEAGFFLSCWQAHSNHYGVPRHAIISESGCKTLLCSISRSAIHDFESRYRNITTINITVPKDILINRLRARGREDNAQIEKRLQRAHGAITARDLIIFDNSRPLAESLPVFLSLLDSLCRESG